MDWIPIAVALVGSVAGAYLGVKVSVSVLQVQMAQVLEEIRSLRDSRHDHAGMLSEHEMRLDALERDRK